MCFSATASFTAAACLTGLGAWSLSRVRSWRAVPFASIPLLFAVQQASEGFVWRMLRDSLRWKLDSKVVFLYLLFALAIWPAWVPFSAAAMETNPVRRRWLWALTGAGTGLGAYLFSRAIAHEAYACEIQSRLYYAVRLGKPLQPLWHGLYLLATLAPLFVSSVKGTRPFAIALAVSYAVAGYLYRVEIVSVWCFFSAWLSVLVTRVRSNDAAAERAAQTA